MKTPAIIQNLLMDYFKWLTGGLVAIVLVLGYLLVLDDKIASIRTSGLLERANVEAELKTEQDYLQALKKSISKFETVLSAADLAEIDSFIPTGADFPGLLLILDSVAASANLQLETMSINTTGQVAVTDNNEKPAASGNTGDNSAAAATSDSLDLSTQDVTVTVSGGHNYEAVKRFLTAVESSQRLLDVVSISFSHDIAGPAESAQSTYNVVIRTYYLPASKV